MFAQVPEARSLFDRVDGDDTSSAKFIGHAMRVLAGLDIAIGLLDQPEALKAQLDHLHEQHEDRHVTDQYYKVNHSLQMFSVHSVLYTQSQLNTNVNRQLVKRTSVR